MIGFHVSYALYDEDSVEAGESFERGFIVEDVSLRDALQTGLDYHSGLPHCEADSAPVTLAFPSRWFSFDQFNKYSHDWFTTGIDESRALHLPEAVTASSRMRIARLVGCRVTT